MSEVSVCNAGVNCCDLVSTTGLQAVFVSASQSSADWTLPSMLKAQ